MERDYRDYYAFACTFGIVLFWLSGLYIDGLVAAVLSIFGMLYIDLAEMRGMRQDLNDWMQADVDNHYEKDKKLMELLEKLAEKKKHAR